MATQVEGDNQTTSKVPKIDTGSRSQRSIQWEEVVNFLTAHGFDEYTETFQSEGFDRMEALFDINMEDLKELQIKRGHAKMILKQIEEFKTSASARRVRFGASPNTPALLTMETIDEHASAHPPSSPDMQPSDLLKSNISQVSVTALLAPLTHAQTLSGSVNSVEYSNKSNRTVLIRAASARSDEFESDGGIIPYSNTDVSIATNDSLGASLKQKSLRLSPQNSITYHSEAGTVIMRESLIDQKEINRIETVVPNYASSPPAGPIEPDMHNDLSALVDNLRNAKYEENKHFDEYHEALVSLTTNWDRERTEKRLKYMNATNNYSNWVILDLLGVLNAQMGNTEMAIKFHSESIRKSNNRYIEAMHNYAYLLHRLGDEQNDLMAVKFYKMALQINPSFAHCWLHYGNLLEDAGKLKEAAEMYRRAIEIRPTKAEFHLDLANVYDDLNMYMKATESYLKCIEIQPNDPVYHWNYAISLENQCFYYKAEEAYKRAINLDFECIDAHLNYAHMLETQATPQFRKAMKEYEIILQIPEMSQSTDIMMKLARLYDRFGLVDKTEEIYMNILRIEPNNEEAYILFAQYLTALNRIEDANACYQAGIRHVQTAKLQEEYIQFLKDINNVYNRPKNGSAANGSHKMANSNTYAFGRKTGNMRSPTTLSSSSNTTVSSVGSNAPMGAMTGNGGNGTNAMGNGMGNGYGNRQFMSPSPFMTARNSDGSRPSSASTKSVGRNSTQRTRRGPNANGVVTTGDEQGCIVM